MLAWRPGDLTRRYINGQRARFVSPLALFLFSVFLLFAVLQLVSGPGFNNISVGNQIYHSTDEAIVGVQTKIAKLEKKRAKADQFDKAEIEQSLAQEHRALTTLLHFKKEGVNDASLTDNKEDAATSELPLVRNAIARAKANPQLAVYKLQDAASKFAWLLIPISVPFLWLLFPFSRRFKLYDHCVFVTYSLSFMMLLADVLTVWGAARIPAVPAPALII